ncbi:MAG: prepilin-type N-terminal cleavage/methylation domain-containing protein [Pseudomonadota bacterium]
MKRRAGFTLIELLVAISILAIVAVLGWRGLDGIVRARVALTGQMDTTRGMQLAFAQLQSDCEHLKIFANGARPFLQTEPDRLTLVRLVVGENEASRLQVVAYRIRDGVLTRRESAATRDLAELDVLWKASVSDADTTPAVPLEAGVNGMQSQIWEANGWRLAPSGTLPPRGLQVALTVQGQQASISKAFLLGGI